MINLSTQVMLFLWIAVTAIFAAPFLFFAFVYVYKTIQERKYKPNQWLDEVNWEDINES